MKASSLLGLLAALFLQAAPLACRMAVPGLAAEPSPLIAVMKWIGTVVAVAGSYHAVSAATAVLVSPTRIQGTAGSRLSHQIKIDDGTARLPQSWVINGKTYTNEGLTTESMPPGLSMRLNTAIISGVPSRAGTFSVAITACELSNQQGASLDFTLRFEISSILSSPLITVHPSAAKVHMGETAQFSVLATGPPSLTFQWKRNGSDIRDATNATIVLRSVSESQAGNYQVLVSNSQGDSISSSALLEVVPLHLKLEGSGPGLKLSVQAIPGRTYQLEANTTLASSGWVWIGRLTATTNRAHFADLEMEPESRFWRCLASP